MATEAARSHSLMTRVSHWGITASFVLLFGTGAAIYDHRPRFHIGTSVLALPRIPLWLAITASPRLIHYIFAAVFVLFGAAYYAWGWYKGHFKHFILDRNDIANLVPMQLYYLALRKDPPQHGRYNPLQKLAYSAVLFVIAPLIAVTGAAMLPLPMFHPLARIFVGGVLFWHFALMSVLCVFVVGHLVMVLATGFIKNMKPMLAGDSQPHGRALRETGLGTGRCVDIHVGGASARLDQSLRRPTG